MLSLAAREGMIHLDFERLFATLTKVSGLQRRDWEHNQSGTDREIEAVLIQRSPRELATYALARIRITAGASGWQRPARSGKFPIGSD